MEDFVGVDASQTEGELHEPVDYYFLGDGGLALFVVLYEEGEVALLAVLHYDDEDPILQEVLVVFHNESAFEPLQDLDLGEMGGYFLHGGLLLLVLHAF